MDHPVANYWKLRLADLEQALKNNNFDVYTADDIQQAKDIVIDKILPAAMPKSISFGGSMTFVSTGLYHDLKKLKHIDVIDTIEKNISLEEMIERRRHALLVDMFFTGTNAVTESGQLVNLDMIGNRVAGLTFGPKHVVVMLGRNKIVADLEDAMFRIKNYAAPTNTMRLDKKTPCVKTSRCMDCNSPDRICNTWTITEKSFPRGRIKVVIINEELGL